SRCGPGRAGRRAPKAVEGIGDPNRARTGRLEPSRRSVARSIACSAMAVTIRIPTTLRPAAGGNSTVEVEGATLGDALKALDAAHPGFAERILDDDGNLRRFVNVYVADDDVRFLDGLATPVPDGETISIVPA